VKRNYIMYHLDHTGYLIITYLSKLGCDISFLFPQSPRMFTHMEGRRVSVHSDKPEWGNNGKVWAVAENLGMTPRGALISGRSVAGPKTFNQGHEVTS
jgi:hypothetical protein